MFPCQECPDFGSEECSRCEYREYLIAACCGYSNLNFEDESKPEENPNRAYRFMSSGLGD